MLIKATDRYDSLIQFYCFIADLDWKLIKAQIAVESNFNPKAISNKGCKGLGQFRDSTFHEWSGKETDPFNPEESIRAQTLYMAWLKKKISRYNESSRTEGIGKWEEDQEIDQKALACYNWGIGNMKEYLSKHKNEKDWDWKANLPDETRKYIQKITKIFKVYSEVT